MTILKNNTDVYWWVWIAIAILLWYLLHYLACHLYQMNANTSKTRSVRFHCLWTKTKRFLLHPFFLVAVVAVVVHPPSPLPSPCPLPSMLLGWNMGTFAFSSRPKIKTPSFLDHLLYRHFGRQKTRSSHSRIRITWSVILWWLSKCGTRRTTQILWGSHRLRCMLLFITRGMFIGIRRQTGIVRWRPVGQRVCAFTLCILSVFWLYSSSLLRLLLDFVNSNTFFNAFV